MQKGPEYYFFRLLARILGEPGAAAFVRRCCVQFLAIPSLHRVVEPNFRRVWAYGRGREATTEETTLFFSEMAALLAEERLAALELQRDPAHCPVPADAELLPDIEALRRAGRGVLLVTPHFGDVKMLILGLAGCGVPLHVMVSYAGPSGRALEAVRPNLRFADFGSGAQYYLDVLARNEVVLLYTDMDFFPGGRTADFFGAPCHPPHGPARLALATGAPILPAYTVFERGRHHLRCDAPILPEGLSQEEIEGRILRSIETFISRHPAHWQMFHDPWDLKARALAARNQMRYIRFNLMMDDWWRRLGFRP